MSRHYRVRPVTDGDAILAAVLANPEDDLPRLVYADWLDENAGGPVPCRACGGSGWRVARTRVAEMDRDEYNLSESRCGACGGTGAVSDGFAERAEFIRVQVEVARLYPDEVCVWPDCPLRIRQRQLFAGPWASSWFVPLHPCLGRTLFARHMPPGSLPIALIRRGFVSEIRGPLAGVLEHLPAIVAGEPVERVEVTDAHPTPVSDAPTPDSVGWTYFAGEGLVGSGYHVPNAVARRMDRTYYHSRQAAAGALSAALIAHAREPTTRPTDGHQPPAPHPDLTRRFRELVRVWKRDTEAESSIARMARHPAYREIIGMGERAVPLLLTELQRKPDFWFAALRELTGQDPVPREAAGKIRQMTRAWLKWGRENGHLP